MIRLKDIAKICNLSITQTSRALNNHHDVSLSTKKDVQRIAKEMGYVKNLNAQILVNKNSNQIAVIVHGLDSNRNIEESLFLNTIKGINKFAKENELETIIHFTEGKNFSYLKYCKERGITGVIIVGADESSSKLEDIAKSDFPCVAIDTLITGQRKGCVLVDNTYYSMVATNEIIKKKRKKIAMFTGHKCYTDTKERISGFENALKNAEQVSDKSLIVDCEYNYKIAYQETKKLLEKHPDIDGVFCASDLMALGFIEAARILGKNIPKDISVFGFDGICSGEYSSPKLSTIKQNNLEKGYSAGKLLLEILKKNINLEKILIPCEVILRGSC